MIMQLVIKDDTVERIEAVTGKRISRGGDKLVNEVLNMAEGKEPDDNEPKIMMCAGLKETLEN